MRGAALALVLLVPLTALAAPRGKKSAPAGDTLAAAKRAMAVGRFEQARKTLERVYRQARSNAAKAEAMLLAGECAYALGRNDQALESFSRALRHDPLASLDPGRVSPSLIELLDEARRGVTGTLSVSASEPGCEVKVGGRDMGPAPLKTAMPVGRHQVEVVAADGRSVVESTVIYAGKIVELTFRMPAASSAPVEQAKAAPRAEALPEQARPTPEAAREVASPSRMSGALMVGGGVLMMVGGTFGALHAARVSKAWGLQQPGQPNAENPTVTRADFDLARLLMPVSVGLGVGGLGLSGFGVYRWASAGPSTQDLVLVPDARTTAQVRWSIRF